MGSILRASCASKHYFIFVRIFLCNATFLMLWVLDTCSTKGRIKACMESWLGALVQQTQRPSQCWAPPRLSTLSSHRCVSLAWCYACNLLAHDEDTCTSSCPYAVPFNLPASLWHAAVFRIVRTQARAQVPRNTFHATTLHAPTLDNGCALRRHHRLFLLSFSREHHFLPWLRIAPC